MAGMQRSAVSFRRQGSSGLVLDNKFLSRECINLRDDDQDSGDSRGTSDFVRPPLERSRSAREGARRYHWTARDSQVAEHPSPRVSACGLCCAFGKTPHGGGKARKTKHGNKRLR